MSQSFMRARPYGPTDFPAACDAYQTVIRHEDVFDDREWAVLSFWIERSLAFMLRTLLVPRGDGESQRCRLPYDPTAHVEVLAA
jgi:hypothetical protein